MPRYIDADKLVEKYERAMKDVWNKKTRPLSWNEAYDCVITDIVDEPTAEVVPKSEVDRLNAVMKDMDEQRAYTINMLVENFENAKTENEKLTIKMNAYGLTAKRLAEENESLEIELENMRRNLGDAREGWNDAECEVERLQKALSEYEETSGLKKAKQEVAREIFGEIKYNFEDLRKVEYANPPLQVVFNLLDYLEKKYTEEKT